MISGFPHCLIQPLYKPAPALSLMSHPIQKFLHFWGNIICLSSCAQENLSGFVIKLQQWRLFTVVSKCVLMQALPKNIKGADKNNVTLLKLTIICSSFNEIEVYHPLIVSRPLWQIVIA